MPNATSGLASHARRADGHRLLFGLIVVAAGLLALLDGLHLGGLPPLRTLWPLALVAFGMARLARPAHAGGWLAGLALIGVGVALTGQNLGFWQLSMRQWTPVWMVLGGLALVLRGMFPRRGA